MATLPCPSGNIPYVIRPEDTLTRIAALYNTSVADILAVNPELRANRLEVGSTLCIPIPIQRYPLCSSANYYIVQRGDTLSAIANYFNINVDQILYNNFGISENIYPDQILCIPVAPSPVSLFVRVADRNLVVLRNTRAYRVYPILPMTNWNRVPLGSFTVISKQADLDAPVGSRWLGLTETASGIRSQNTGEFVKQLVTPGDMILSDANARELFNLVPVGTALSIVKS